jgi:hypothetical protein
VPSEILQSSAQQIGGNIAVSAMRDNGLTILVTGIVRNVASTIERDVFVIQRALSNFHTVKWFLVESDSEDKTVDQLSKISLTNKNFRFTSLGSIQNLALPRTVGMAKARNRYLQELREHPEYQSVDILAVSDFNGLNRKLTQDSVASCFDVGSWDACFANQSGRYYDIWALRHPIWSPNDCWQQHAFYRKYYKIPEFALSASLKSRMIRIPRKSDWIEVDSAFGGFALYRSDAIGNAIYEGLTAEGIAICEHVPFHSEMRKNQKKLFINPAMINAKSTDHIFRMNVFSTVIRLAKYPMKITKVLLAKSQSQK